MYEFNRNVSKIKEETLIEMIKLLKKGELDINLPKIHKKLLPGPNPTYRGSLYLERAVLKQRIKIYLGLDYDKSKNWELYELKDKLDEILSGKSKLDAQKNIIQIVAEACDACPSGKFYITDICRTCLEKNCVKNCPKNAVSIVDRRARINQEKCIKCGICKKSCKYFAVAELKKPCKLACPVDAIDDDENGYSKINRKKCVTCGQCVLACPFGAIDASASLLRVVNEIKKGRKVTAICAPSIIAQFGVNVNFNQIKAALKAVGIHDVVDGYFDALEVAYGADMVAMEEAKHLEESSEFMTTSCCPSFVQYIEKHQTKFIKNISPVLSPMLKLGEKIRKEDPETLIVFIGPCFAKKIEAKKVKTIDHAITFEGLQFLFEEAGVDPANFTDEGERQGTKEGWNFAAVGGVSAYVNKECSKDLKIEIMDGINEAKSLFQDIENRNCDLLEGMACKGGCIGGPGTLANINVARAILKKIK